MGLNSTPNANRVHIGIFGKRNAGKSSLINAITNQKIAIVSDILGTTTDPVYKAMELLPLGAVVMIDTAGLDDVGELGEMRVKKTIQVLNKTDIALVVIDFNIGLTEVEEKLITKIKEKNIPYLLVFNKADDINIIPETQDKNSIYVSTTKNIGIHKLKEKIANLVPNDKNKYQLISDLIEPNDFVVLVTPIDASAPKGRLILPQQQTIRDILETRCIAVVCQETELKQTLGYLCKNPKLVVCDSQVFGKVSAIVPNDILLTSFSILFARYKGNLEELVKGTKAINNLKDGDKVLIAEGCTHHRQCEDIGTVKIPKWLKEYTGKDIKFETASGIEFPENLAEYKLIIHCGGCTLNEKEMKYRIKCAKDKNVPIVNYGIFIAYTHGILRRSLECFPDILSYLN